MVNAIAVADGGGRLKLSYGSGAGPVPRDVSVYKITTYAAATTIQDGEAGQVVFVINGMGADIEVEGETIVIGAAAGFVFDGTDWYRMN